MNKVGSRRGSTGGSDHKVGCEKSVYRGDEVVCTKQSGGVSACARNIKSRVVVEIRSGRVKNKNNRTGEIEVELEIILALGTPKNKKQRALRANKAEVRELLERLLEREEGRRRRQREKGRQEYSRERATRE
ncbi:hypothetical protein PMAC_001056, partial [Pneumocystis sp. 'macacae']